MSYFIKEKNTHQNKNSEFNTN